VAELVWSKLTHPATDKTATMRAGPLRQRARWVEPAAAAVGLARGGWQIGSRLEGHVANPTHPGLPGQTVIVAIDGRTFAASNDWSAAIDQMDAGRHTFTTDTGERYSFEGRPFPISRSRPCSSRRATSMWSSVAGWRAPRLVVGTAIWRADRHTV
jgi:hypothetical protein